MRISATYLYCLVRRPDLPAAEGAPPGLPGLSAPRALAVGDGLWLVAADAPLPEYGAESIQVHLQDLNWVSERAMAHEAVVEHFGKSGTLVPMKLFTLFASDDRALEHIRGDRERLDRILDRIAGCQEWGVLVRMDETKARQMASEEARRQAGGQGSGTAFLLRKRMEQEASRTLLGRLRGEMEKVFSDLGGEAAEARKRDPILPVLLDSAFLVRKDQVSRFEKTVDLWAKRLAESCEVTLTGPWPPYNFIGEETP
jgi:Gas vesicle synthesis protein GvpL/GvpF